MPRIHSEDIRGMSLQDLMDLLQAAADDGTYPREDIERVLAKIRKRILDGEALIHNVIDHHVYNYVGEEIIKKSGGFDR